MSKPNCRFWSVSIVPNNDNHLEPDDKTAGQPVVEVAP